MAPANKKKSAKKTTNKGGGGKKKQREIVIIEDDVYASPAISTTQTQKKAKTLPKPVKPPKSVPEGGHFIWISESEAVAFDLGVEEEVIVIREEQKIYDLPSRVADRFYVGEELAPARAPKIPQEAWVVDYNALVETTDLSYYPLVLRDPTAYPADSIPDHRCEFFKGPDGSRMHDGLCWCMDPVGVCSVCYNGLHYCLRCMDHGEHENMNYFYSMLCEDGYRDGMTWPRPDHDVHVLVAMTVRPELFSTQASNTTYIVLIS